MVGHFDADAGSKLYADSQLWLGRHVVVSQPCHPYVLTQVIKREPPLVIGHVVCRSNQRITIYALSIL